MHVYRQKRTNSNPTLQVRLDEGNNNQLYGKRGSHWSWMCFVVMLVTAGADSAGQIYEEMRESLCSSAQRRRTCPTVALRLRPPILPVNARHEWCKKQRTSGDTHSGTRNGRRRDGTSNSTGTIPGDSCLPLCYHHSRRLPCSLAPPVLKDSKATTATFVRGTCLQHRLDGGTSRGRWIIHNDPVSRRESIADMFKG